MSTTDQFRAALADYLKRAKMNDSTAPSRWERIRRRYPMQLAAYRTAHPYWHAPHDTSAAGRPAMTSEERQRRRAERRRRHGQRRYRTLFG